MFLDKQQQQPKGDTEHHHRYPYHQPQHKTSKSATVDSSFWVEAKRYMRYATAVYGQAMIQAAEVDARGNLPGGGFSTVTKKAISHHIAVPPDDIVVMDVDYDGDCEHLRHMVVVDHQHRKVVLSIRGTFSLGEIVIDAAAFSREFCGGEAHSEMANMAENVWSVAGPTVQTMLAANHHQYELILTGHSLGAGAACLLTILLESKRILPKHQKFRCFAYAAPPVFTPLEFVPNSVQATTNFVHENDVIPFLSVHTVRQLFQQIRAVDAYAHDAMTRRERYKVLLGIQPPPQDLIASVLEAYGKPIQPKQGAPILSIPAHHIVWLKQQQQRRRVPLSTPQQQQHSSSSGVDGDKEEENDGDYAFEILKPIEMKQPGIRVNPDMLLDHFPPRYEHALDHIIQGPGL